MQHTFFHLLEEENKRGTTILFSSHVLGEVQRLCSRVAIIKEGRIMSVANVQDLREHSYKKIKVETFSGISNDFFKIDGVNNVEVHGNAISFLFQGNINLVLKKISELTLSNILIEEPSLEEIFMHYYRKED